MNNFTVEDLVSQLEDIVQQDEGGRGIKDIILKGQLSLAAKKLVECTSVVIITGFPCMLDYEIPSETDGPLGAISIAKSCLALGKRVAILTDECNEQVLLAAVAASNLQNYNSNRSIDMEVDTTEDEGGLQFVLESFPPAPSFDVDDQRRLDELMLEYDMVVAIERPGPSRSGQYFTMRKRDMSAIVSPLDRIINFDKVSIGIGDGGNEVGIGKVYDKMIASSIPNAIDIACVTATDYLIVASVSNWGGYALSAAVAALMIDAEQIEDESSRRAALDLFIPTVDEQIEVCQRMIDAGARDGITAKRELSVDGMPLDVSLAILNKLRDLVLHYRR